MDASPDAVRQPRARALPALSLGPLAERGAELARGWAVGLVLSRRVERIGAIALEEIAFEGAELCGAVIEALRSDEALARLTADSVQDADPGWPRRFARMAGAVEPAEIVLASEALRGAVWEALSDTLGDGGRRELAAAGDRLAHVCALLAAAALARGGTATTQPDTDPTPGALPGDPDAESPSESGAAQGSGEAVIVDELWEPPIRAHAPLAHAPATGAVREIEIRDARGAEGPGAWIGAIGRQLDRFAGDGRPFTVLLVEVLGADDPDAQQPAELVNARIERLLASVAGLGLETIEREGLATGGAAHARGGEGSLTCERGGRYWLVAPGVDRIRGEQLAQRLLDAAASLATASGTAVALVIGTATCPLDGMRASTLAAHADVGLYAARAALRATPAPSVDGSR